MVNESLDFLFCFRWFFEMVGMGRGFEILDDVIRVGPRLVFLVALVPSVLLQYHNLP